MIKGTRRSDVMMTLSSVDETNELPDPLDLDQYYYSYIDQYVIEMFFENDLVFSSDILEGECFQYLLDGPMEKDEFSFDHVIRIDELLNNKPLLYVNENEKI